MRRRLARVLVPVVVGGAVVAVGAARQDGDPAQPASTSGTLEAAWQPEYAPWDGALDYYRANGFVNSFGDLGDDFFPIAWFGDHGGDPDNLARHRALGFNTLVAIDSDASDLANIRAAGLYAIVAMQDDVVELDEDDLDVVKAWYVLDEPDNAAPGDAECTTPARLAEMTARVRGVDPTRPRMVIFGDGLAVGPPVTDNAWYIGRGRCFGQDDDYARYILADEFQAEQPGAGVEIVSFDHYVLGQTGGRPVARTPDGGSEDDKVVGPDALHSVAEGRERAYGLVPEIRSRPFWQVLEAVPFTGEYGIAPNAAQLRYLAWSSIIHGATGIVWWDLQMRPQYNDGLVIDDAERAATMHRLNAEIHALAPVINGSAPVTNGVTVDSQGSPVHTLVKLSGDSRYVFAAAMRNEPAQVTFTVPGIDAATVEVLNEDGRTLDVTDGTFTDSFEGYGVHLYKVTPVG